MRREKRGERGGREGGKRRQRNRGPFRRIPEWQLNKALRSSYDWDVALSRALTNLLRHDHHAEVAAQGFMDTAGWVAVKDIVTIPSIAAWTVDKVEIRAVAMNQSSRKFRLEYECNGDKIRCAQGFGTTVGDKVDFSKIFAKVDE